MPISNHEHVLTREHSCNVYCNQETDEHCQVIFFPREYVAKIKDLDRFFFGKYTFTAGTTITGWREAPEAQPQGVQTDDGRWLVLRPSPFDNLRRLKPVPNPEEYRGFVISFTIEEY